MEVLAKLKGSPCAFRATILTVLVTKVFVFSLGFAATYFNEGAASPLSIIMRQFCRWDGPHYIDIARNWYVNEGEQRFFIVFFPLYPLLIRLTTFSFEYINLSALFVSNVSSIFAAAYLFKLTKLDFDDEAAFWAVVYLSVFPTAYFLSATFTEGLFLALAIASVYYARTGKWPFAGVLSLFAALTRITGVLLFPSLAVEYLHQKTWKLRKLDFNLFWSFLALAGFLIYLGINFQVTGNCFTFMEIQRAHWCQYLDPLAGLGNAWNWANTAAFPDNITVGVAPMAFAFFAMLMILMGFKLRFRVSLNVYMLLVLGLSIATSWWISVPRYVIAMFPMFTLLGFTFHLTPAKYLVAAVFTALLSFFTVLFSMNFWAF